MSDRTAAPLLTLEPLIEAVRDGVEAEGWELSGLQKTTSHQFEGRWAGASSRSAYLFFHLPRGPERASVEAFLDETSEGLDGNLALVMDACALERLGAVPEALEALGRLSASHMPPGYRSPVSLRLRLEDGAQAPGTAAIEVRFKLMIPRKAFAAGAPAIAALAALAIRSFREILAHPTLTRYRAE